MTQNDGDGILSCYYCCFIVIVSFQHHGIVSPKCTSVLKSSFKVEVVKTITLEEIFPKKGELDGIFSINQNALNDGNGLER